MDVMVLLSVPIHPCMQRSCLCVLINSVPVMSMRWYLYFLPALLLFFLDAFLFVLFVHMKNASHACREYKIHMCAHDCFVLCMNFYLYECKMVDDFC